MHNTPDICREVVASLPKVLLHEHLDGGLRPQTVVDLARECGYTDLPTTDAEELGAWFVEAGNAGSLPKYLSAFGHTCGVMQTADALARVAREAVEDLAADNVVYAELRMAPENHLEKGLTLQEVIDAVVEGLIEGEAAAYAAGKEITARLIICAMRQENTSKEIAQLTIDNHGSNSEHDYVVGFDIAGPENGFPPSNHAEAFAMLRENLVPFTIHAGEDAGVDSLREAVVLGASRLGHGVRTCEDFTASMEGIELQDVARFIRDQRILLEMCPTSNVQTGVVDNIADHPFTLLDDYGFTCTVNTDNRLLGGITMTDEMMVLVDTFDYGYTELFDLTCNAINHAFADLPTRERIMDTLIYPPYLALTDQDGDGEVDPDETLEVHLH
ncbi:MULTISPECIES: adenosine deaminase [unclassified Corynebacterium]|uniref:adenosine deaminase n=1 Tax=unclassified Corynebacterium TaxID=2624378 RepID=UPI0030AC0193